MRGPEARESRPRSEAQRQMTSAFVRLFFWPQRLAVCLFLAHIDEPQRSVKIVSYLRITRRALAVPGCCPRQPNLTHSCPRRGATVAAQHASWRCMRARHRRIAAKFPVCRNAARDRFCGRGSVSASLHSWPSNRFTAPCDSRANYIDWLSFPRRREPTSRS